MTRPHICQIDCVVAGAGTLRFNFIGIFLQKLPKWWIVDEIRATSIQTGIRRGVGDVLPLQPHVAVKCEIQAVNIP
jgi:hypothetical protein